MRKKRLDPRGGKKHLDGRSGSRQRRSPKNKRRDRDLVGCEREADVRLSANLDPKRKKRKKREKGQGRRNARSPAYENQHMLTKGGKT